MLSQLVFRIIKLPPDLDMGQDHHHIQSTCFQNYQTPSWPWNGSRSPPHTVNLCSELSNSLLTLTWVKITTTYSQLVFRIIKLPPDLDMGQDHHHMQSTCVQNYQTPSWPWHGSRSPPHTVNLCSELSNSLLTLTWVKITTTYSQLVFRIIKLPPDLDMGQDHHHMQSTCVQNYQTPSWPWHGSRSPPHAVNLCSELSNSLLTLTWVKITTTSSQLVFRIIKLPPDLDMGQDHHHIQSTCVQNYQTPSWPWHGSRSPPHTVNLFSELSNSLLTLKWVKITTT